MEKPQKYGSRNLGARPLAVAAAVAYLVVGGVVGALVLREEPAAEAGPPDVRTSAPNLPLITTTRPRSTTTTSTTRSVSTTATGLPAGFRTVNAPGGLVTAIPSTWLVAEGSVATTLVATDPADPGREVRFGGAPVTDASLTLLERIALVADERQKQPGHQRFALTGTRIRGFTAVRWEYETTANGPPKRVAASYWEANGIEYVIYASGPRDQWAATWSLLDTMTGLSRP